MQVVGAPNRADNIKYETIVRLGKHTNDLVVQADQASLQGNATPILLALAGWRVADRPTLQAAHASLDNLGSFCAEQACTSFFSRRKNDLAEPKPDARCPRCVDLVALVGTLRPTKIEAAGATATGGASTTDGPSPGTATPTPAPESGDHGDLIIAGLVLGCSLVTVALIAIFIRRARLRLNQRKAGGREIQKRRRRSTRAASGVGGPRDASRQGPRQPLEPNSSEDLESSAAVVPTLGRSPEQDSYLLSGKSAVAVNMPSQPSAGRVGLWESPTEPAAPPLGPPHADESTGSSRGHRRHTKALLPTDKGRLARKRNTEDTENTATERERTNLARPVYRLHTKLNPDGFVEHDGILMRAYAADDHILSAARVGDEVELRPDGTGSFLIVGSRRWIRNG